METRILLSNMSFSLNLLIYPHCNEAKFVNLGEGFLVVLLILIRRGLCIFDVDKDCPIFRHLPALYDCLLFH